MRIILLTLISITWCYGQNHVITALDSGKYHLPIGDLIVNRPTNGVPFADGINQLRYTNFSRSFPTFREGGTIWIDGKTIGSLCEIRFLNGTETTPWHVSTVSIKPLPGTQIKGIYTKNSYGGFLYLVQGVKNLTMSGSSVEYPGLNKLEKGNFLKGRFGFSGTSTGVYYGFHVFSISVLNGGSFTFEGFEGEHGFSCLRFQGGSYDWNVKLVVRNFYAHDTDSEGFYIGATHTAPYARIEVDIKDGIMARTGSEAIQLQHLIGNSWVRSITAYANDAGYLNQFQPSQDTGSQFSPDAGNITIEDLIMDTWGSHGTNLFGSPYVSDQKSTTIRKILYNNGRGEAVYIHPSCKYGMNWTLDSLFIRNLNGEYYINSKTVQPSWIISKNNGTDQFMIVNNFYKDLLDVEYVNSGFYEPSNRIKFYERYYAKYITGLDSMSVKYLVGDILQVRVPFSLPVYVKVVQDFIADPTLPQNRKECIVLSWDNSGTRSDQPAWDKTSEQKNYPPDDLRVKNNNFYGRLGIGFVEEGKPLDILVTELEHQLEMLKYENLELNTTISDQNIKISVLESSNEKLKQNLTDLISALDIVVDRYK